MVTPLNFFRCQGQLRRMIMGLLLLWQTGLRAEPVKLAIIADGGEAGKAADILAPEFSRATNLVLLERKEIERVYRELSLSTENGTNKLKAGQLLGADGMFLVSAVQSDSRTYLDFRLVAVNPGVVLESYRQAWPITNYVVWAKLLHQHFEPQLAKLRGLGKDAIPLSILNFRAAVKNPNSLRLGNELTALLINRLGREQDLFLLERRGLPRAQFEKDLAVKDEAFWSGRYLLEGTLDAQNYQPDTVVVSVRLLPPENAPAIDFEINGPRGEPVVLAEKLAVKVLELLNKKPSGVDWQTAAEADQYLKEAQWAYRWGMVEEAQSASETAWALGTKSIDLAILRLRSFTAAVRMSGEEGSAASFLRPPMLRRLESTRRSLEIYSEGSHYFSPTITDTNKDWQIAGIELAEAAAIRLGYYHEWYRSSPDLRAKYDERLTDVRLQMRELAAVIEAQEKKPDVLGRWERVKLSYGKHWCDRPEQAFPYYTSILTSPEIAAFRVGLVNGTNLLTAWSPDDEARLQVVWLNFIKNWQASTNPLIRLEGLMMSLRGGMPAEPAGWPAWNKEYKTLLDLILKKHGDHIFLNYDPIDLRGAVDALYFNAQYHKASVEYRQEMGLIRDEFYRQVEAEKLLYQFKTLKERLLVENRYQDEMISAANQQTLTAGQARELLPLLEKYQQRVGGDGYKVIAFMTRLKELVKPEPVKPLPPPAASPVAVVTGGSGTARPDANILKISRAWSPDLKGFGFSNAVVPSIIAARYQGSRLWVLCRFDAEVNGKYSLQTALYAVDPKTLEADGMLLPSSAGIDHRVDLQCGFDVSETHIYVSARGQLACYDRKAKTWHSIPLPIEEDVTVSIGKERVFLGGEESILELDPMTGKVSVLANCRRKPGMTALDGLPSLGSPPLFAGKEGGLQAFVQGKLYYYDETKQNWRNLTPEPWAQWSFSEFTSQGMLLKKRKLDLTFSQLFETTPAGGFLPILAPHAGVSCGARWTARLPEGFDVLQADVCSGKLVCWRRPAGQDPRHRLWILDDRWDEPMEVPLELVSARSEQVDELRMGSKTVVLNMGVAHAFFAVENGASSRQALIWFLSAEQLQQHIDLHGPRTLPERKEYILRQKYDLNHDGQLEPEEIIQMRVDPAYQKEEPQELAEALKHLGENLLSTYDVNHDQKLNQQELGAMIYYENVFPIFNANNMLMYDSNSNGGLELAELEILVARMQRVNFRIGLPPRLAQAFKPPWLGPDGKPLPNYPPPPRPGFPGGMLPLPRPVIPKQ